MTASNPSRDQVQQNYNNWLIAEGGRPYTQFESYVEGLCRFVTLEIAAGRMFWSFDLPGDQYLLGCFNNYREKLGLSRVRKNNSKK